MIEQDILNLQKNDLNKVVSKKINLDYRLDFFILIESNDKDFVGIIENHILDLIIDNISINNTYKDFSLVLDKINSFLRDYNKNKKTDFYLNILLGVLNKNDFIFSTIGKPSVYLIKDTKETIEITDKNENKKTFTYISEGELEDGDILIIASSRLLNYLSYSDFTDSVGFKNIEKINKNILLIIQNEIENNIGLITLRYKNLRQKETKFSKLKQKLNDFFVRLADNNFVKFIIAYFKLFIGKIRQKSKLVKNILLISGIVLSALFLYIILNSTILTTIKNDELLENKALLEQAKKYKLLASENYTNKDKFLYNIEQAEEILNELKQKKVFLGDIQLLQRDINSIKKAFVGIETFKENEKNLEYSLAKFKKEDIIEVLKNNGKTYIILKNKIIGPIIGGVKPKISEFSNLGDDSFIDATPYNHSIILLTKKGKIVEFTKSGTFVFKDVVGQETWEKANRILSYNGNLYLINDRQIFKHTRYGNKFSKAQAYLKQKDVENIGGIESIAIDGGFYILRKNLKILKFFSKPYRIEKIKLISLPIDFSSQNIGKAKIIARKDLNYVYILLNNKIWIFKPNTRFYNKVQSLKYLGQIEAFSSKIIDFFVEKDGNIILLNSKGVYNLRFNENDGKILISN